MPHVVIVGSCVQDLISYTPRFPNPGESVRGSKFMTGFGGKGANQAVAAARLGAETAMIAKVGNDIFGPPTIENFKENGVMCDNVSITSEASTATATITVSESGQNAIVVILGANELLSVGDLKKAESQIKSAKVLCCQLEIKTEVTLEALKMAKANGVTTIFNPAPGLPDLNPELLKYSDVLCPNESEGAGDSFVGSLAYYIALHPDLSIDEKIRRSCTIASISVQSYGTQLSYPWKNDLNSNLYN